MNLEKINIKKEKSYIEDLKENPEFKEWFNGSFVRNEKGEPLMVYHSTTKKEIKENTLLRNPSSEDWTSYGIYFSDSKNLVKETLLTFYNDNINRYKNLLLNPEISQDEKIDIEKELLNLENNHEPLTKTFSAFLSIKNPLILESHDKLMELYFENNETFESLSKKYDGIIVNWDTDFGTQYIAFSSEQIQLLPSDI